MTQTAAAIRPDRDEYKPINQLQTINEALTNKNVVARFQSCATKHLSAERMLRVCAMAVYKNPDLAKCELMSLLGAMLQCQSLGIEPNTQLGHAYLIPFRARRKGPTGKWEDYYQVQLIIGYRGLIDLARRTGMLTSIHADVVYEGDEFSFEYGSNMHLRHVPGGKRDKALWAYAHAKLSDGEAFEVRPYNLVMDVRDNSQGYRSALDAKIDAQNDPQKAYRMKAYESNPWVAFEHEMASKTMVRSLAKMLPMSIEFARAVELDSRGEVETIDFARGVHSQEALEYAETVPFDPPTVDHRDPVPANQEMADRPRRGRPPKASEPPAEAAPAVPPPPPPQPMPEPARAEPEIEVAAFELVTHDGEALEWSDINDFPEAYHEYLTSAFRAGGIAAGDGFYETNRATFLAWAKNNTAQGAELEEIYHGLRKANMPPDEQSGQRSIF